MLNPALDAEPQTNTASLIVALANYATGFAIRSGNAITATRHCLIDALGGGFEALREPQCAALIGPLVPGCLMPGGARVPGTSLELDPAQAAFCTALMLSRPASRSHYLMSHNGHAPEALGALLAVVDYQARKAIMEGKSPPKVRDLLAAMVKTTEIQGALAAEGAAIRATRIAVTTVATAQLGGGVGQIFTALSYACIDRAAHLESDERYGARGDWARADAISRSVRYACQALAASPSQPTPLELDSGDLEPLGARRLGPRQPFATAIIDQLAANRRPQEVAEVTLRFNAAVDRHFPARQSERIRTLFASPERLDELPVNELLAALVVNGAR